MLRNFICKGRKNCFWQKINPSSGAAAKVFLNFGTAFIEVSMTPGLKIAGVTSTLSHL